MIEPFPLPMVFVAWGTAPGKNWEGGSIGGGLLTPAQSAKVATIAFEIGQCTLQHVKWAHERGFFVVVWNVVGADLGAWLDALSYVDSAGTRRGPDGIMVQVEGDGQYDGAIAGLTTIKDWTIPKAVVTTYGGMVDHTSDATIRSGSKYKALKALGVSACFVECYASDAPGHEDLDRMLGQGVVYGIPAGDLVAVCGTFRGEMPSAYKGLATQGREFAIYLAEAMSTEQWKAWGAVNPTPPTPTPQPVKLGYWQVRAGAALLHEVRAKTFPDGTTGLRRSILWLQENEDVVRRAKAVQLIHVMR